MQSRDWAVAIAAHLPTVQEHAVKLTLRIRRIAWVRILDEPYATNVPVRQPRGSDAGRLDL